MHQNLPAVTVAVCAHRCTGIDTLIATQNIAAFVLDDAFQHRKVKGSLYILLTTLDQPFYNDMVLPAGNLRESATNKNRADIIIVTKCPPDLSDINAQYIISKINPLPHQSVFFTRIHYGSALCFHGVMPWQSIKKVLLITGIVDPTPLIDHLSALHIEVIPMTYRDHYPYEISDIEKIKKKLMDLGGAVAAVTTSKDRVKIQPLLTDKTDDFSFFEIPISVDFLFDQNLTFTTDIELHVR